MNDSIKNKEKILNLNTDSIAYIHFQDGFLTVNEIKCMGYPYVKSERFYYGTFTNMDFDVDFSERFKYAHLSLNGVNCKFLCNINNEISIIVNKKFTDIEKATLKGNVICHE